MKEKIKEIIIDTINEYNEGLSSYDQISTTSENTIYGKNSNLDSWGNKWTTPLTLVIFGCVTPLNLL